MIICPLHLADPDARPDFGAKAANLNRLLQTGLPVPAGFVVTLDAYRKHVQRASLAETLKPLLERQNHAVAATAAAQLITKTPFDPELEDSVAAHWSRMGSPAVAVRSSANTEDLPGVSFAGQYDSFLNITSYDALMNAIRLCWASLWSERALRYRAEQRVSAEHAAMGVIVQKMVPAEVAGVIFSVDPLSQDRQRMLIEAAPGLGDALVSGKALSESGLIERIGPHFRPASAPLRLIPQVQRQALGSLALRIESVMGGPQDIEFAIAKNEIWILQARPITTLGDPVPAPPPLRLVDRRMQKLTLERYAIAPRPFDNVAFVRMVGASVYAARQFGLIVDEKDFEDFRRQPWHQQYRFPRSRLTFRLFLHPFREPAMLRTDWFGWWLSGPRKTLEDLSSPVDLASLGDAALFERADSILSIWEDLCNRRFFAVSSVDAENWLQGLVALATGPRSAAEITGKLLSGLSTPTSVANDALWDLSRLARADAAVSDAIRNDQWGSIPPDAPFASALRSYLERFGHRESGGFYLSLPTWRHDSTPLRQILRSLLDADQRPASDVTVHLQARETVERRLRWCPWLRKRFVTLLDQVRALHRMREESHFDLTRPLDALQAIAAEAGLRLQHRGLLSTPRDIFYLHYDEARLWLLSGPPADTDPKGFIARRQATYRLVNARWQQHRQQPAKTGNAFRGSPASPGRMRGPARIILNEESFNRLQPGDILVCPHSNPSWTPLFLTAAGVVSETGGPASHAAIVAREYGIPAVLAVTGATKLIRDGALIEVDGNSGRVSLLNETAREA